MSLAAPTRTTFRTWDQIAEKELNPTTNNPFEPYSTLLTELAATPADAYQRMWELY